MQKIFTIALATLLLNSFDTYASLTSETTTHIAAGEEPVAQKDKDPLRPFNKTMTHFNEVFDGIVIAPFVELYSILVPDTIKEKVYNVVHNLGTPYTLVNNILQGDEARAGESFARFIANSTFGIAGLFDVADRYLDIPPHTKDFGQTLAVWGADEGFYLVLPFLGPSTFRDTLGLGVGIFLDPMNHILDRVGDSALVWTRWGVTAFERRVRSDQALKYINSSSNPYETAKSLYLQNREFETKNGNVEQESPTPDDM